MNADNQRHLTPLLAVAAAALAVALLALFSGVGRGVSWLPPRPLAAAPSTHHAASLLPPVPLQDFAIVWQKPLFSPDRKPVAAIADGGTSLGDLTLTGIILTPGLRMALLRNKNGDRQVRLRQGEATPDGSITLVEVRPRSALFDAAGGRTELKLPAGAAFDDAKGGITPADAAASDDPKASSGALISMGARGPGKQSAAPADAGASGSVPPPSDSSSAAAIQRLRAINSRRRAERAAATH